MNIAIITGASAGLGKEFARQIDNYHLDELWLVARRKDRLLELSNHLKTRSVLIQCDLTESLNILIDKIRTEKPNIRYLVNNAGFGKVGDFKDISLNEQLNMIDLNVRALVELTHNCLPFMRKGSTIINIASIAGFAPMPSFSIYAATKAFVLSFSNSINEELKGIHSIAVCPGPVETEFHLRSGRSRHLQKKAKAKDVVRLALKDAKKKKNISVYGAKMKAARLLSKLISRRTASRLVNKFR
ncbi:MAG: SDR family NAD(P)-dependent oxidoreductase [Nanoarchaeota archaeon]|nr:SDR family NAD(P)-dependent oxidoreductase [Nanoarchaeota archaeon]MBU1704875.1 SDR family NAD(P)-dependent oxidoreductase [Nanoarchaeota archaeon]